MTYVQRFVTYPDSATLVSARGTTAALPAAPAIGDVRTDVAPSQYNLAEISQALRGEITLANPSTSPGCSPVLRLLLMQSGAPHSVTAELYQDGQVYGHGGGNALDVAPPAGSANVEPIIHAVRSLPTAYATASFYDTATSTVRIFIWDGVVVAAEDMTDDQVEFAKLTVGSVHLSSSYARLRRAFRQGGAASQAVTEANQAEFYPPGGPVYGPPYQLSVATREDPRPLTQRW